MALNGSFYDPIDFAFSCYSAAAFARAFLRPAFFATAGFPAYFAALTAAHRLLVASMIFFLPTALSFRFLGFADPGEAV